MIVNFLLALVCLKRKKNTLTKYNFHLTSTYLVKNQGHFNLFISLQENLIPQTAEEEKK